MSDERRKERVKEKEFFDDVKRNYYLEFQQEEGIPVYTGFYLSDLKTPELKPWPRMGGLGAYVNLFGEETMGDNYLCEIPPSKSLNPQRHMFEELVYVLSGRGATNYWTNEGAPIGTFEWQENSFFALPANIGYQHFNGDGKKPAKLFAKTTLPALFQYFKSKKYLFKNDFIFEEMGKDFYSPEAKIYKGQPPDYQLIWIANFVPDTRTFNKMEDLQSRGAGGTSVHFYHSGLIRLHSHMSEFPVGTYKKAHAHPPGRSIIILSGKGFSIVWQPGKEMEKQRIDWQPGSLFGVGLSALQGECWYHQHFNTGSEPARYLVLHVNTPLLKDKHVTVEYVDEDPEMRKLFESELAKSGIKSKMPPECYVDRKFEWQG